MNAVLLDVTGGLVAYGDWIWAVVGFLVAATGPQGHTPPLRT